MPAAIVSVVSPSLTDQLTKTRSPITTPKFKASLLSWPQKLFDATNSSKSHWGMHTSPLSLHADTPHVQFSPFSHHLSKRHCAIPGTAKKTHKATVTFCRPWIDFKRACVTETKPESVPSFQDRHHFQALVSEFFCKAFVDNDTHQHIVNYLPHSSLIVVHSAALSADSNAYEKSELHGAIAFHASSNNVFVNYLCASGSPFDQQGKSRSCKTPNLSCLSEETTVHTKDIANLHSKGIGTFLLTLCQLFTSTHDLATSSEELSSVNSRTTLLPIHAQVNLYESRAIQHHHNLGFYVVDLGKTPNSSVYHLPPDLQSAIVDLNVAPSTSGVCLHQSSPDPSEGTMCLMRVDIGIATFIPPCPPVFKYSVPEDVVNSQHDDAFTMTDKLNAKPFDDSRNLINFNIDGNKCAACDVHDNSVSTDACCVYCFKPLHLDKTCAREMQQTDSEAAQWRVSSNSQQAVTQCHPFFLVCEKCDENWIHGSKCSMQKKLTIKADGSPLVCMSGCSDFSSKINCIACNVPVHAKCAKWVINLSNKERQHRSPVCLSCTVDHDNAKLTERNVRYLMTTILSLANENDCLQQGEDLSGANTITNKVLGPFFDIKLHEKHWYEDCQCFKDVTRRVPAIGPLALHKFINPFAAVADDKHRRDTVWQRTQFEQQWFFTNVMLIDGPLLRPETHLSDAILNAICPVLNAVAQNSNRCIFLGPQASLGWDSSPQDTQVGENIDLSNDSSPPAIDASHASHVGENVDLSNDTSPSDNEAIDLSTVQSKSPWSHRSNSGTVSRKFVNNRHMNYETLFAEGCKGVCFVLQEHEQQHWWGVYCEKRKEKLYFQCVDTLQTVDRGTIDSVKTFLWRIFQTEPRHPMRNRFV
mmetsp:Transcript_14177/g.19925  ORF Transcript_14177/g.19925 Transcript_14177/m.19925 type:complete len:869 (-) Transcript_14177:2287-4893(-)